MAGVAPSAAAVATVFDAIDVGKTGYLPVHDFVTFVWGPTARIPHIL